MVGGSHLQLKNQRTRIADPHPDLRSYPPPPIPPTRHTDAVGEMGNPPQRLILADLRGGGRYLRVSWHAETATLVVSHWVGDVCVASTPLGLTEAARMIGLLVGALQDTAAAGLRAAETSPAGSARRRPGPLGQLVERVERRFRPRMAQIVELGERLRPRPEPGSEQRR